MSREKVSTAVTFQGGKNKWEVVPSPLIDMTKPDIDELDRIDRARSGGAKPAVRNTYTDRHTGDRKVDFNQVYN